MLIKPRLQQLVMIEQAIHNLPISQEELKSIKLLVEKIIKAVKPHIQAEVK